jgi:hypothetical protein
MSATERRKGAEAEREVIRLLHKYGWEKAERTSNGRNQSGRGDVANGPANTHIEIKRQERLSVPAAFDQIRRDARPLEMPILIHRPSRHVWMATTELNRFLPMLCLWEFR